MVEQIFKPQKEDKCTLNKNHHNVLKQLKENLIKNKQKLKKEPYKSLTKNER